MFKPITNIRRVTAAVLITCAAVGAIAVSSASAAVPAVAQAWHYEVHFVNNTGHTLAPATENGGGGESWDTKPPASGTPGQTGTFEVGSTDMSASGLVVYQDQQNGATVTFSGHQGYYSGMTPHINVTYTLSY